MFEHLQVLLSCTFKIHYVVEVDDIVSVGVAGPSGLITTHSYLSQPIYNNLTVKCITSLWVSSGTNKYIYNRPLLTLSPTLLPLSLPLTHSLYSVRHSVLQTLILMLTSICLLTLLNFSNYVIRLRGRNQYKMNIRSFKFLCVLEVGRVNY